MDCSFQTSFDSSVFRRLASQRVMGMESPDNRRKADDSCQPGRVRGSRQEHETLPAVEPDTRGPSSMG